MPDFDININETWNYTLPEEVVRDGESVSWDDNCEELLENDEPIPDWLNFDGNTRDFFGTPTANIDYEWCVRRQDADSNWTSYAF